MMWRFTLSSATFGTLILSDEPEGWAESVLEFKRDKDWHGIFFNYTLTLSFYETGYDYLKKVYETAGIDEYVELLVEIKCAETDPFEDFYAGKVVMGTLFFDCEDDCMVQARIDPAGCLMTFRNRMDQKVDLDANLDFDGNALAPYTGLGTTISLLPKSIVKRSLGDIDHTHSVSTDDTQVITQGTGTAARASLSFYSVPIDTFTLNEISTVSTTSVVWALSSPATLPSQVSLLEPGVYGIDYQYLIGVESWALTEDNSTEPQGCSWGAYSPAQWEEFTEWQLTFVIEKNGSIIHTNVFENRTGDCIIGHKSGQWTVNGSLSLSLAAGDTIRATVRVRSSGVWDRNLIFNRNLDFNNIVQFVDFPGVDNYFNVQALIQNPPTPCRVYLINEALSRTVEGITDDCLRVYSDYFGRTDAQPYTSPQDGCGSLEVIMKGLHIRQFPDADVLMAVSFKDLFDALNSVHCIGIGLEPDPNRTGNDRLRVEPFHYWYDNSTVLLQCDNVPAVRRKVTPGDYISLYSFGYEKWEAEDSMGLDEFNTKREFRTTRTEVKSTLDRRCKFIASGYAIEVTRTKPYIDDSTKDWRWDNDTFLLCVRRDLGNIVVEQGQDCADTATMTGVIDPPTLYNYRISPIRNLMRWARFLFSNYYPNTFAPNAQFIFNNGDGNFKAKGKLLNGCYQEAANTAENDTITTANFLSPFDAQPVFIYETVEFDYPVAWQDVRNWRLNPSLLRGKIQYRTRSTDPWSEGYVLQVQYKPVDGLATFTLLPKFP